MESTDNTLRKRFNWRRGVYRLLTAFGVLWFIGLTYFAAMRSDEWPTDAKVVNDSYDRLLTILRPCEESACTGLPSRVEAAQREGKSYDATVAEVISDLSARVQREQANLAAVKATKMPSDTLPVTSKRPQALDELEQRLKLAETRYEAARKRYETAQGDTTSNWLAMDDAKKIMESAKENHLEKLDAWRCPKGGRCPVGNLTPMKFDAQGHLLEDAEFQKLTPEAKTIVAQKLGLGDDATIAASIKLLTLTGARTLIINQNQVGRLASEIEFARKSRKTIALYFLLAALMPILLAVGTIETIAWIFRGFSRTSAAGVK